MKRANSAAANTLVKRATPITRVPLEKPQPLLMLSRARRREQLPESRVFELHSLDQVHEVTDFLPKGSLVASDLDNVLMEPVQLIGSDQWFEAMYSHLHNVHAGDKQKVHAELIPLYNKIHQHTEVKPVEKHVPLFVHRLQSKHKTCGLTTRGKELAEATQRQLHSISINFNRTTEHKDKEVDLSHIGPASKVVNGLIFAGGKDKGDCLIAFMQAMGYNRENTPHIFFIDDKPHHVEKVREAARKLGIKFTGVRYAHLDEKIKQVDLEIADEQHAHHIKFGRFLTDQEALDALQAKRAAQKNGALKPKC